MKLNFNLSMRLLIIVALIVYFILSYPGFYPVPALTGKVASFSLNALGMESVSHENYLVVGFTDFNRILELSAECSGVILFCIFLLVIFVVPDLTLKHRLMAFAFIPLLFVANLLRIILGIVLGYHISVDFLVFFHNTIGQVLVFFLAIGVYMLWLYLSGNFPTERRHYKKDLDF